MLCSTQLSSPLGPLVLASNGQALTGLWLAGQRYFPAELPPRREGLPLFAQAQAWLEAYFSGARPAWDLPLAPAGTAFQRLVWELLLEIPYGQTTTYGALARQAAARLGRDSMSSQAVGGAVGRNPISILIPCHRVLGADGGLVGYAGGVEKKRWLLRREGALPAEGLLLNGPGALVEDFAKNLQGNP